MAIQFTSATQPQKPEGWSPSLDPSLYAQGLIHQGQQLEKQGDKIQQFGDAFASVTAMSPQDEKVLNEKKQQFFADISKLNLGDLKSPQTRQAVNQYITQYSNDPDILAIARRSSFIKKELATEKEYAAKGITYVPKIKQAEKYIQDGNYYRDKQFNGSGYVAPDDKEYDNIQKITPEFETWATSGNYDVHQKGKAVSALAGNAYNTFKTNPKFIARHDDQFEQLMENTDVYQIANQGLAGIQQLFPNLPPEAQQQALDDLTEGLSLQQNNPYFEGSMRAMLRDKFDKDQALQYAEARAYTNTVDMRANSFAISARDFQEAKQLAEYKKELDLEYPKDSEDVISLVQGLEDFKANKQGIPGLLTTDIFQKEITVPEESTESEIIDGVETPSKKTVKNVKKKVSPRAVGYREFDDTFTISYPDGSLDQLTTQQIIDKVGSSKPALGKYLKTKKSSDDPLNLF